MAFPTSLPASTCLHFPCAPPLLNPNDPRRPSKYLLHTVFQPDRPVPRAVSAKSVPYPLLAFFGHGSLTRSQDYLLFPSSPVTLLALRPGSWLQFCVFFGRWQPSQTEFRQFCCFALQDSVPNERHRCPEPYLSWSCSLIRNICFLGVTKMFPLLFCFVRGNNLSC